MDIRLSEEQEMLRGMARDFLTLECPLSLVREMAKDDKGFPDKLWRKMAEVGWMGIFFPEKYGGTGGTFLDLCVLQEELGYAAVPGPFFSSVILGGLVLLEAGNEKQKQEFLARISTGDLITALALIDTAARYEADGITTTAVPDGDSFTINGTKLFVLDAHVADLIICVARLADGISSFVVDAGSEGISMTPLRTIAGDKQFEIRLDKVRVPGERILGNPGNGWESIESVLRKAAVAKCAEMVGGAQRVLDITLAYAKDRVQFGKPIGSFQAIQHYCANMATDVEACRFATYEAAWKISCDQPAVMSSAVAKGYTSYAFRRIAAVAHQIFGAIGFAEDHELPVHHRRAKAAEVMLGDSRFHREIVATEIGL